MSQSSVCRLCVTMCEDYRSLFDENGQGNDAHQLMLKYFDEKFLDTERGNTLIVLCLQCWGTIFDFHNFQEFVYEAQKKLLKTEQALCITSEENEGCKTGAIASDIKDQCKDEFNLEENTVVGCSVKPCGEIILKGEEEPCISVPKLEMVDVFSGDDNFSDDDHEEFVPHERYENERGDGIQTSDEESLLTECEFDESEDGLLDCKASPTAAIAELSSSTSNCDANNATQVEDSDALIAQWKPNLECVVCTKPYPKLTLLQQHFQQDHPLDEFCIVCCHRKLKERCIIEKHMHCHINPKDHKCALCERSYKHRSSLNLHMRYHFLDSRKKSSDKELDDLIVNWKGHLECAICAQTFSSFKLLRMHFRHEHPGMAFHVACCGRKWRQRCAIEEHIRCHIDPNAFKCELCSKRYTSQRYLDMHKVKMHFNSSKNNVNMLNLKCGACKNTFSDYKLLEEHFRQMHPRENTYMICCRRQFSQAREIEDHMSCHAKSRIYQCKLCGKRYNSRKCLLSHRRERHHTVVDEKRRKITDEDLDELVAQLNTPITCGECNSMCLSVTLLREHFNQEHPKNILNMFCCKRKLKDRYRIEEHLLYHIDPDVFKCEQCNRRYTIRQHLTEHKLTHNYNNDEKKACRNLYSKTGQELDDFVAQWKQNLECVLCKGMHSSLSSLRQHFQEEHPQKVFYIACCGRKLKVKYRIMEHIRFHMDPDAFKCEVCEKRYKMQWHLTLHRRSNPQCRIVKEINTSM